MSVPKWRQVIIVSLLPLLIGLVGCLNRSPRVVKIGLVAPFVGRYREIGVDVIPAARLAVREWAAHHTDAPIAIELVAYDDAGDPDEAASQAQNLVVDPAVQLVVGHWREDTTSAAEPVYSQAHLPLITYEEISNTNGGTVYLIGPNKSTTNQQVTNWSSRQLNKFNMRLDETDLVKAATEVTGDTDYLIGASDWGLSQFNALLNGDSSEVYFASGFAMPSDQQGDYWTDERVANFVNKFEEGSLGAPPGFYSMAAYEATWFALDLISRKYGITEEDSPVTKWQFDSNNHRINALLYLYHWASGDRQLVAVFP